MKTDNVARLELVGRSETARRVASSEAGIAAHSGTTGRDPDQRQLVEKLGGSDDAKP